MQVLHLLAFPFKRKKPSFSFEAESVIMDQLINLSNVWKGWCNFSLWALLSSMWTGLPLINVMHCCWAKFTVRTCFKFIFYTYRSATLATDKNFKASQTKLPSKGRIFFSEFSELPSRLLIFFKKIIYLISKSQHGRGLPMLASTTLWIAKPRKTTPSEHCSWGRRGLVFSTLPL